VRNAKTTVNPFAKMIAASKKNPANSVFLTEIVNGPDIKEL